MVLRAYPEKGRSIGQGNTEFELIKGPKGWRDWLLGMLTIQVIFCYFHHWKSVADATSLCTRERWW